MSRSFLDVFGKDEFLKICSEATSFTDAYRKMNIDYRTFKATAEQLGIFNQLKKQLKSQKGSTHPKGQVFAIKTKTGWGWKVDSKLWCEEVFKGNVIPSHPYRFKDRLVEAGFKENKCDGCGIVDWRGKPITLQCHHIDGDERNNKLENIEFLCPNCHSQTDNYLSKNKKR